MRMALAFLLLVSLVLPAGAEGQKAARPSELDRLLTALRTAPSEQVAGAIETRVRQIWLKQATPAAALLLNRGERNMAADADQEALDDFDAVLDLQPDLAEGFAHRAAARYAVGDYAGAVRDIEETLRREPRHFPSFAALSRIAEARGDWPGALAAWQRALDISPRSPGGVDRLLTLQKKVDGEAT